MTAAGAQVWLTAAPAVGLGAAASRSRDGRAAKGGGSGAGQEGVWQRQMGPPNCVSPSCRGPGRPSEASRGSTCRVGGEEGGGRWARGCRGQGSPGACANLRFHPSSRLGRAPGGRGFSTEDAKKRRCRASPQGGGGPGAATTRFLEETRASEQVAAGGRTWPHGGRPSRRHSFEAGDTVQENPLHRGGLGDRTCRLHLPFGRRIVLSWRQMRLARRRKEPSPSCAYPWNSTGC